MSPFIALLLGIVEGLTEFLPVSSTGHLLVATDLLKRFGALGTNVEAVESFDIVVQAGAILAVAVQYRALLADHIRGVLRGDKAAIRWFAALALAFMPMAILGLTFRKIIKRVLFGPAPVAVALIVGGVVMIAFEGWRQRRKATEQDGLEHVTTKRAFAIGCGQCLALIPGTSRSLSTILAGQLTGLSARTAAEFSFLLGLPTLGAATLYEGFKSRHELAEHVGAVPMAIGLVTSFVVALFVIRGFIAFLGRGSLRGFGVYRIVAGVVILVLTFASHA